MQMALVQMKAVRKVSNFLAASHRQHFVRGRVPEIETPPEFKIGFNWKETEGSVLNLLDLGLQVATPDDCATKFRLHSAYRFDLEARLRQHLCVGFVGAQQRLRQVVKHIHVFGTPRGVFLLMQHRAPPQ